MIKMWVLFIEVNILYYLAFILFNFLLKRSASINIPKFSDNYMLNIFFIYPSQVAFRIVKASVKIVMREFKLSWLFVPYLFTFSLIIGMIGLPYSILNLIYHVYKYKNVGKALYHLDSSIANHSIHVRGRNISTNMKKIVQFLNISKVEVGHKNLSHALISLDKKKIPLDFILTKSKFVYINGEKLKTTDTKIIINNSFEQKFITNISNVNHSERHLLPSFLENFKFDITIQGLNDLKRVKNADESIGKLEVVNEKVMQK